VLPLRDKYILSKFFKKNFEITKLTKKSSEIFLKLSIRESSIPHSIYDSYYLKRDKQHGLLKILNKNSSFRYTFSRIYHSMCD